MDASDGQEFTSVVAVCPKRDYIIMRHGEVEEERRIIAAEVFKEAFHTENPETLTDEEIGDLFISRVMRRRLGC